MASVVTFRGWTIDKERGYISADRFILGVAVSR